MITSSIVAPKLKKGTQHILDGRTVYVFHDRQDGTAVISYNSDYSDDFIHPVSELKPVAKLRKPIASKRTTPAQRAEKSELDVFFDQMALVIPKHCENCGADLITSTKFAKRSCTAHIFPKSKFPEIATNPLNILYLGAGFLGGCQCHDQFDTNADNRSKMPVYAIALQRFHALRREIPAHRLPAAFTHLNIDWS